MEKTVLEYVIERALQKYNPEKGSRFYRLFLLIEKVKKRQADGWMLCVEDGKLIYHHHWKLIWMKSFKLNQKKFMKLFNFQYNFENTKVSEPTLFSFLMNSKNNLHESKN